MKYQLLKLLFLGLLFIGQSTYAIEPLSAKQIGPKSSEKADALYNEAQRLYDQKKYQKAIELYSQSYEFKPSGDAAHNLGSSYDKIQDYNNAIKWYKISANKFNNKDALYNLGLDCKRMNNIEEAIKWYKKAIKKGDLDSYDNIALIYHDIKKDNLTASAYYIGTIDKSYTKKEILDFLRDDWKIDEDTLKKAYQLQKTLDIPKHYYDSEFEDQTTKKSGRR